MLRCFKSNRPDYMLIDLIMKLLSKDPTKRPLNIYEIKSHPWFCPPLAISRPPSHRVGDPSPAQQMPKQNLAILWDKISRKQLRPPLVPQEIFISRLQKRPPHARGAPTDFMLDTGFFSRNYTRRPIAQLQDLVN